MPPAAGIVPSAVPVWLRAQDQKISRNPRDPYEIDATVSTSQRSGANKMGAPPARPASCPPSETSRPHGEATRRRIQGPCQRAKHTVGLPLAPIAVGPTTARCQCATLSSNSRPSLPLSRTVPYRTVPKQRPPPPNLFYLVQDKETPAPRTKVRAHSSKRA